MTVTSPLGRAEPGAAPLPRAHVYTFGPFQLDLALHELRRDGTPVPLGPKALDTLVALVELRHRVVHKDELMQLVWPDTAVSEDSLTQTIWAIRRALGDSTAHPTFVATVARRGYRFIAPASEQPAEVSRPGSAPSDAERVGGPRRTLIATAAVALLTGLAIGAALIVVTRTRPAAVGPISFTQESPPGTAIVSGGVLSPDSQQLAFLARDLVSGRTRLWLRPLAMTEARPLDGTDGALRPFWSPDSRAIAFFVDDLLRSIALDGGAVRTIATVGVRASGTWGSGERILVAARQSGLSLVDAAGGALNPLRLLDRAAGETAHQWPQFLADGRRFLYYVASTNPERSGTYLGTVDSNIQVRLLDGTVSPAGYAPPGYLLYVRDGVLTAQPFDSSGARLTGSPVSIMDGIASPSVMTMSSISATAGGLLAFERGRAASQLVWFDRRGARLSTVEIPTLLHNPTISPDGRTLLGNSVDQPLRGIWTVDLTRGGAMRLVPDALMASWSPDGRRLAFALARSGGGADVYMRRVGGTSNDPLVASDDAKAVLDWSPDGAFVLYASSDGGTKQDLWLAPTGGGSPRPYLRTPFNEIQGRISPDGTRIAYASDESGTWQVYLQSFPSPGEKRALSVQGGTHPHWRSDGRELFYLSPDHTMMSIAVVRMEEFGRPEPLFRVPVAGDATVYRNPYTVTDDGERFLIDTVTEAPRDPITVIVNWSDRFTP